MFTVLDAKTGFWHMELEEVFVLTTFNTPFGQHRWRGWLLASVQFQECFSDTCMSSLRVSERLRYLLIFAVVGFGNMHKEAVKDHKTLEKFLLWCAARGIWLNNTRETEVLFIDHMAADEGQCVDPTKV